jgi:hypothetical protein
MSEAHHNVAFAAHGEPGRGRRANTIHLDLAAMLSLNCSGPGFPHQQRWSLLSRKITTSTSWNGRTRRKWRLKVQ